ncbi:reverse transcriptase domain-containing protein [Tanacetum coccineum]
MGSKLLVGSLVNNNKLEIEMNKAGNKLLHLSTSSADVINILLRRNRRGSKKIVEPQLRTIVETPVATMADTRTMSELLQAPTEGYRDAIVIPAILAKNFELKVGLLQLVTSSQFHSFERDDPHSHIRWFNKITSTLKYKNVPHEAIKLMLFPFSLKGAAWIWLEKEPPHSLNATAGGNLLNRTPRDTLTIIENKSKVRTSRNKPVVLKASATSSSTPAYLPEITALTDAVKAMLLQPPSPAPKKLSLPELTPGRMTLKLANLSVAYPVGVAKDVFVKVGKFHFPADFIVVDYDVDPRIPLILGRPFLRTARALIDKSNHLSSGSTAPLSDSLPSLTPFETSDSLLEEFADELALRDPFPPRNKDDNFDPEADLRKIEYLLNREPSIESSPKYDIEIIDPILERFTDKPAHIYSPLPGNDDNDNDDLFTTSLLVLPIMEPEDTLITWDENLSTIPEKESDEFIKSSIEDLVLIPSESEDTSDNDSECDLPFCDNSVTFSNHLFDSNDDFTFSDDESFLKEDV